MQNNSKEKVRNSPSKIAIIGATLALVGGFFLFYNYIEEKQIVAQDYMSHKLYNVVENVKVETMEILEEEDFYQIDNGQELTGAISNDYIGYLTIPKINFVKGFLDSRSPENNVDKNIMVIEGSDYPDVARGNFMIAGHSGRGWKAFFSELHQIQIGDIAIIDYKGKKYTYTIKNIYTQPKTGTIAVYRNNNVSTLTLITCTENDSASQSIYIAELTNTQG